MTTEDLNARIKRECAEQAANDAAYLAEAKSRAIERGKEPFDLDRLDLFYSEHRSGHWGTPPTREERIERLEEAYYVSFPDIMTLEEFAKKMEVMDVYE